MKNSPRKFRHELKFIISPEKSLALKQRLQTVLEKDHFCIGDRYRVTSLYLDDYQLSSYFDKLNGENNRAKYRLRAYNLSDDYISFEIKFKDGDLVNKQSFLLTRNKFNEYLKNPISLPTQITDFSNASTIINLKNKLSFLRPKIIVDYLRTPLILDAGNVRITFDERLQMSTTQADFFAENKQVYQQIFPNQETILEVKYDEYLPSEIQNLLSAQKLSKTAASKYVLCMQKARQNYELIRN